MLYCLLDDIKFNWKLVVVVSIVIEILHINIFYKNIILLCLSFEIVLLVMKKDRIKKTQQFFSCFPYGRIKVVLEKYFLLICLFIWFLLLKSIVFFITKDSNDFNISFIALCLSLVLEIVYLMFGFLCKIQIAEDIFNILAIICITLVNIFYENFYKCILFIGVKTSVLFLILIMGVIIISTFYIYVRKDL